MSIQKTFSILLCFPLWAQTIVLRAQTTQGVGINTENLQGVFHVDAAGDNSSQADDIVVTDTGYVGVGTHTPSARLHIHTQGQAGVFPLRIADGSQDNNKMMTSGNEGVASWQAPPAPPSSTIYNIRIAPRETYQLGSETPVTNSAFTVPEDGFYSADIRFWGQGIHYTNTTTIYWTATRLQLKKKRGGVESIVDEFQYNEPSYTRVTVFVTLYAEALQGDELSLWVYPVKGFNAGLTANPVADSDYDWIKTKILYKKLGVNDDTHYFD